MIDNLRSALSRLSSEVQPAEVIKHRRKYWAVLSINVVVSSLLVLLSIVVPVLALEALRFALERLTGNSLAHLTFGVSGASALAAFAVLATLIVALQVGVRAPILTKERDAASARQMILETMARLCGIGALAIGIAATANHLPTSTRVDLIPLLGPIAGAFLLALFAGDAASASSARLGSAIVAENRKAFISRLKVAAGRIASTTQPSSRPGYVLQLATAFVFVPYAIVSLSLLQWAGASRPAFVVAMIVCVSLLAIASVTLSVAVRGQRARGDWIGVVYFSLIAAVAAAAAAVLIFALQPWAWPTDARTLLGRSLVVVLFFAAWLGSCAVLIWHVPISRQRGLGTAVLLMSLNRTLDGELAEKKPGTSLRTVAIVVLSIIAPPIGLLWAYRVRRRERALSTTSDVDSGAPSYRLGFVFLALWLSVIVALIIWNPAIG